MHGNMKVNDGRINEKQILVCKAMALNDKALLFESYRIREGDLYYVTN